MLSGLGIAALPYYVVEEAPGLVEILPELGGPRMDAYLVYPEELRHSRRIDAVRDFLLSEVREEAKAARLKKEASALLAADAVPIATEAPVEQP